MPSQGRVGGFQIFPQPPEEIDFVVQREWNLIQALRERRRWTCDFRTIPGIPVTRRIRICAHRGEQARRSYSRQRTSLIQAIPCGSERLVRSQQLLLVVIEFFLVENFPPRSLGNRIFGRDLAPWTFRFPGWGRWDRRALILWVPRRIPPDPCWRPPRAATSHFMNAYLPGCRRRR